MRTVIFSLVETVLICGVVGILATILPRRQPTRPLRCTACGFGSESIYEIAHHKCRHG